MYEVKSLTDAVKEAAGISLTKAVKEAGCEDWIRDEAAEEQATVSRRRMLATGARLAAVLGLASALLPATATSTATIPGAEPDPHPPAGRRRVAFVVGNAAYRSTLPLENPRNDAFDVSDALRTLGFHVVEGFDLDKRTFDAKIAAFAEVLKDAEVGLFFYAGHGLQVAAQNYLIPIDAKLTTIAALDAEMVRLDLIHQAMKKEARINLLFLDACRNNPLSRNLARALGPRSAQIGQGLAAIEGGADTLISFSTRPGKVALDGVDRNSPFSGALVRQLRASKDDLNAMLIAVRNDVLRQTNGTQVPWEHSALTRQFFFNPRG